MRTKSLTIVNIVMGAILLASMFLIGNTASQSGVYDPWKDINDDGWIDIMDFYFLATGYGTHGTPINKTALLLDLQARVEALESMQGWWLERNSTSARGVRATSSTSFEDVPNMTVTITLTRNSTLLVLFSTQALVSDPDEYVYVRAMANGIQLHPTSDYVFLAHHTYWSSHSVVFFGDFIPGVYNVRIQWRVFQNTHQGSVDERTLTVLSLPS